MKTLTRVIALIVAAVLLLSVVYVVVAPLVYATDSIAMTISAPYTGDTSILYPMLIVFGVSVACLIVVVILLVTKKKK